MTAKLYVFEKTCPKPSEVVSTVEGQIEAGFNYSLAWMQFWLEMWGFAERK